MSAPEIETPRLLLRDWRDDDLEPLAAICADVECTRYMFGRMPLSRMEAADALERQREHWKTRGFGRWALELRDTGGFAGWTGLRVVEHHRAISPGVEVGWLLDRALWGRGLATEAGAAGLAFGFETLGLERILALYVPGNGASERVMTKLGMHFLTTTADDRDGEPTNVMAIDRASWTAGRAER